MIRLDDLNTAPDNPSSSLNDLTPLKNLQDRERASTPVSIIVRRFYSLLSPRSLFLLLTAFLVGGSDERICNGDAREFQRNVLSVDERQAAFPVCDCGHTFRPLLAIRISVPLATARTRPLQLGFPHLAHITPQLLLSWFPIPRSTTAIIRSPQTRSSRGPGPSDFGQES